MFISWKRTNSKPQPTPSRIRSKSISMTIFGLNLQSWGCNLPAIEPLDLSQELYGWLFIYQIDESELYPVLKVATLRKIVPLQNFQLRHMHIQIHFFLKRSPLLTFENFVFLNLFQFLLNGSDCSGHPESVLQAVV